MRISLRFFSIVKPSRVAGLVHTVPTSASIPLVPVQAQSTLPLRTGRERLVILGTGWGGARLAKDIDPTKYDITVISPRNHFVFTPLLSSTCVGTLEARSVTLPIIDLQRALKWPQNFYYAASAIAVHPSDRLVEARSEDGLQFFVNYDVLVIATGSQGSTFGIPGVEAHTHFLRDAADATSIRDQLMRNWNAANIPGRSLVERDRLLHAVVVGGGPTGVEFGGELADFCNRDLRRIDPDRARDMRITLIEANQLLGSFDSRLREYAARKLTREGVHLLKGAVKEVRTRELELHNGTIIAFGLCVWSTGVGPTPFTLSLPFAKTPKGRIAVDEFLRVLSPDIHSDATHTGTENGDLRLSMKDISIEQDEEDGTTPAGNPRNDVFALGDACANADAPLPALAQVAEQQGKYLARMLNLRAGQLEPAPQGPRFVFRSLGAMATVGGRSAVIELQRPKGGVLSWAGFTSWLAWRSAYLTRLGTLKARLYVMTNWTLTLLFGRDSSRW